MSSRSGARGGRSILDAKAKMRSLPLQYEARYSELLTRTGGESELTVKRIAVSVAVLRELLSAKVLGPFQGFLQRLMGHILDAVYSDEVCTSPIASMANVECLEKVPYFDVAARRSREVERLNGENAALRSKMSDLEDEVSRLKALGQQKYQPNELESRVLELEYKLKMTTDDLNACKLDHSNLVVEKSRDLSRLEHEVESWKRNSTQVSNKLQDLEGKRRYLRHLHQKFTGLRTAQDTEGARGGEGGNAEAFDDFTKLTKQLCMLQNAVMDEYESLLEGTSTEKMRNLRQGFVGDISIVQKELHALMAKLKTFPDRDEDIKRLGLLQEEEFIEKEVKEEAGREDKVFNSERIWARYRKYAEDVDTIPRYRRTFDLAKLSRLVRNILQAKYKAKESAAPDDETQNEFLEDFFYTYLEDIYGLKTTVVHVAFDILSSLKLNFDKEEATVRLFVGLMSGTIDDTLWMYVMQFRSITSIVPLANQIHFEKLLSSLYPGATVTSIDGIIQQYQSKYVQYTKKSVNEFLLRYILSGQELRIQKWQRVLTMKDPEQNGFLEQDAFEDVALSISPKIQRREAAKLFVSAAEHFQSTVLEIDRLAQMAAVLEVSLVVKSIKAEYELISS